MKRFWDKVNKTNNCWEWMGGLFNTGYGGFKLDKKMQKAHRVSWELNNGKIPEEVCVLHKCDNRKCVRPNHLFLGTQSDNIKDMISKGRDNLTVGTPGEKNGRAKLTDNKVDAIRKMYAAGNITMKILARLFDVSQTTVNYIINKKLWKHI